MCAMINRSLKNVLPVEQKPSCLQSSACLLAALGLHPSRRRHLAGLADLAADGPTSAPSRRTASRCNDGDNDRTPIDPSTSCAAPADSSTGNEAARAQTIASSVSASGAPAATAPANGNDFRPLLLIAAGIDTHTFVA